jgi:hypothetical protein
MDEDISVIIRSYICLFVCGKRKSIRKWRQNFEIFAETLGDFCECRAKYPYNRSEGGGEGLSIFRLAS